jgi:tripartite-type tricarboxylate transporter receptor subunit TctC
MAKTKRLIACAAMLAVCAEAATAAAPAGDGYPSKPIRLISPFAPGGGASFIARLLSQDLTEAWGQSVVVDNRAGAGGAIGTEIAARAVPDGYTLVMATASTVIISPLVSKVPFDPVKDFTPIVHTSTVPLVLITHPSVAAKTMKELIALAQNPSSKLNYASSGEGTISHLAAELFKVSSGARMTHIPYKGGGQAIIDLVAGHVQLGFVNILEGLPHVNSGRLRALAVSTSSRSAVMPNLPTAAEAGLPGFEVIQWSGVLGPAKLPDALTQKLNREVNRILAKPEMRERLLASGADPGGGTPERFGTLVKNEIAKWAPVVKTVGMAAGR